jgi:hypothetical protein
MPSNCDDEHRDGGEQVDEQREPPPCPCCGGKMKVSEIFDGTMSRPYSTRRLDTS